jgi:methylase of polypeptide subunit release factors
MKRRRSLTHIGGAVQTTGQRDVAEILGAALDVAPAQEPKGDQRGAADSRDDRDDPDRAHVHGFHAYPARMHPATAARLVRGLSGEGATVLDPFCGSGTVLVEGMIAGRRMIGTDLNPIAVRLASLKTSPRTATERDLLVAMARGVSTFANERRLRRAGATRRYPPEDVATFEPHVLLELDSLRAGIHDVADERVREALQMSLSAILVKVSRKASDTAMHETKRRIAAGYPSRLLVKKAEELARRFAALEALLPPGARRARVTLDDATRLESVAAATVDAVVTSPPYVATYDYLAHHALRMRWLGLDASAFGAGETGSRRRYAPLDASQARSAWTRELTAILRSMARACRKGGRVALLIADSAVQDQALRADALIATIAPGVGLEVLARATQTRPHFHGATARAFEHVPRAEHAIALEKR